MSNDLLATVDLGSNSFRLLIARISEGGVLYPVDQIKETVRLAGGLDANNCLTKESQSFALEVLSRFGERLAGFDKNQVRVVGTSTLRVAKNANEFIAVANKALGFNIEVISGSEEARLIYIGAVHSLAYSAKKRLIVDIGGGSTEFIIGSGYDPQIMESVTIGCVSFSGRYFINGVLNENNFADAVFAARGKIQSMEHLFKKHDWVAAIGTSGTAKSLYELCVENGFADHITQDGLYKLRKLMIKHKNIKNLSLIGLKEDRRPVIPGGLAIMIAIMEELGVENMTIADGALREGVMYDLLGRKSDQDLRVTTVNGLLKRYAIDENQAMRVANTTLYLYKEIVDNEQIEPNYLKLLKWAAQLYEVGLSISHNDYHRHGAYILANSDLAGFSRPEQRVLADLVRAHRGGLVRACESLSTTRKVKTKFLLMIMAFRFSVILNRKRRQLPKNILYSVKSIAKNELELTIDGSWLIRNPLTQHSLNEEIDQWKKMGFKIKLISKLIDVAL
ncbi:MAG: exopolyphosphatase / guanosine-5-triphosphate,3-diphosphate pyrophosphatase [Pseudomonadota bacterium]|nr:exopolyphosphatase / guanosine-5-triphosphate,3-diphosphate pyrophosphatase [Pseudomonadota bacterium]